ncbi:cellular retinoic acid-binding protein 2 isoform X1 [Petaurus breviceps papuanus]|uniref:cellular retinoic acid-binding protein 2 isoform X1 n=1 Tax=Petaurus breviceps papuanus TaxID=3040969 RepID=UPI0036D8A9EE
MSNFSGNWKIIRSENFEDLLKALGVNVMLRKIAVAAASKPAVEIKQDGESFYIKTFTTVRTTEINFKIGEEFEEQTVDGRPCKSLVKWENQNKMVCEQRLLKGEGPKTSWSRELTNDGELILAGLLCQSPEGEQRQEEPGFTLSPPIWRTALVPSPRPQFLSFQTMTADDVVCTRVYVRE